MKRAKLLSIAEIGAPIIRKQAKEVTKIASMEVQTLIDDMIATVKDVDGVGIAAPQVYMSLKAFILASYPNPRYPNAPKMKPKAIINPRITKFSPEKEKDYEGCLSIPGIRGFVPRSTLVEAEYTTRDGKKEKKVFHGFVARIFQHEYDHIQGVVYLDRLESTKDIISEKEFRKLLKKKI